MQSEMTLLERTTDLALMGPGEVPMSPDSPEFREHVQSGAAELARVFHEETSRIRHHWACLSAACRVLDDTMKDGAPDAPSYMRRFDIHLYYDGTSHHDWENKPAIDEIIRRMNVRTWAILIDKMGIKNLMSIKRREEFEKQVEKGDVPEVTEENIVAVIMGLAERAAEFATEAAKEALRLLTPTSGHYKTNSGFRVGRRVVLSWYVDRGWSGGGFRANHYREKELIVLDGAFHILDEKGPIRGHKSPLIQAIGASPDGRGETDYFKFKCFKNRNLHLEFKRPDLVKKLNGLATGEYVLGQDLD